MALTIGDNFSYLGAKPLDGRLKYDTISAMVGMSASTLYDGIMAYCVEDGKEYQWKSTNTADPTLGKWREFASGGGASALDDLTDVDITSATDGQVLKYDSTNSEWVNADEVSVPSAYTSTPEMDGTASAGSSTAWAKGDHVHPSDTAKSDLTNLAASFDDTASYAVGDRCTYNGKLYRFTSVHTGAWVAGDVTEVTVSDEIDQQTGVAVMRGATNYSDGEQGLAPKPYTTDVGKALFGDGKYHTIYSAASGSTILAVTTDSSLFGRTVTLTDGTHTATQTMGNDGECYFTDVQMFGAVTLSCTDAENNEAKASLNLTYFGTYQCNLTLNFATLHFTSSDLDIVGKEVTVYKNNVQVATTTLRLVSGQMVADVFVEELGDYVAKVEQSTSGIGLANVTVSALRQTYNVPLLIYHIYTYQIDENDSNPATCVTPYESAWGCENLNFTPAHMDFTNDVFDYGSWTGNEFFFPKPCMLKYDGTVDYYLDPDDYTKKADGVTASDVANMAYAGNVMVEFPTVYFNRWQSGNKTYVVMSNKQITSDFHAYAHHDKNGNVLPYIYLSAYDGSYDGTRLRSISGIACNNNGSSLATNKIMNFTTRQQECSFATANNNGIATGHEGYYTWHKADGDLIIDLITLLGMNLDSQATFGRGRDTGYVSVTNTGIISTGTMNTKGLFWGENQGAGGVKVFGIENFYGNLWKQRAGWINANGTQKVKMTWGQEDGSTVNGFNFDGSGYTTVSGAMPTGTTSGYINKWKKTAQGFVPYTASGTQTTYVCDGLWFNNSQVDYAVCGGGSTVGAPGGAFSSAVADLASLARWSVGAALSCK